MTAATDETQLIRDIGWAMNTVSRSTRIRRPCWPSDEYMYTKRVGGFLMLCIWEGGGPTDDIDLCSEDLFAVDWEVVS